MKPGDRNIGYVPQDLGLFPTLTVREHLEFALRVRRHSVPAIRERVGELAHQLDIEPLLGRNVQGLSGGEELSSGAGQGTLLRPQILLFDEPLNAVRRADPRSAVRALRSIQKQSGLTVLHVTHSRSEARHGG